MDNSTFVGVGSLLVIDVEALIGTTIFSSKNLYDFSELAYLSLAKVSSCYVFVASSRATCKVDSSLSQDFSSKVFSYFKASRLD